MNKLFLLFIVYLTACGAGAQTSALALSDSLYAVGKYAEAIKVAGNTQPSEAVFLKLAKYYKADGDYGAALDNYRKVLAENPNRLLTAIDYGQLLLRSGNLPQADSLFSGLAKAYPKNASFQYQLGLIKEKQKDSAAMAHYYTAVSLDKEHKAALYKVARHALKSGKYTLAEHFCLQGLKANPGNRPLLSILAQTYSALHLYEEAIPQYEKLLELGEESEFIYSKVAFAYYQIEAYQQAIQNYQQALTFEDRNAATHYSLGKLYALIGDLEKSETHLLMSILIKKQPIDAEYLSLALTYKEMEKYKDALEYLEKALEENPENERALYERAIAADNYFEDLETRMNYYKAYLNKYDPQGNEGMIYLARNRVSDIKKEMHMAEE
ncbi:tetratricopeptide repeat protein [Zunongwangia sp. F363]|uniref:Tetratricopeptide repeat protein n=1 Tax=Autumnicola tepida TaxID=3075595 RepID=A0ABU3CCU3_9FLAO|nr:tetratricopeptide repeat protein [Zunongwangia sp. F363]MDT0643855.1 tetratricopeptide repeat protein [Zunongwangia sp. F363]